MHDYLTIRSNGFVTYCDGLIASIEADQARAYLLSLVGSPAQIQATSAHFYNGGFSRISGIEPTPLELGRTPGTIRSIRARKIGDVVNKVLISAEQFERKAQHAETACSVIVFGEDMPAVKQQAYHRLDNSTTMPLKPQWHDWLWDEVLQPERLYSFGNLQLRQAWKISWQEEELEERILEGIRQGYLG
ncbi:hypothetical protein [Desulfobulbus oligotrophicus]|uniref:Uncharacterized protein n=1 Tax=Desulfobulbus oligotrophicus TaxID=1909699 RepID=A0A7T5VB39_9BACT|nr:hypothetical protein [Desulfobulbus oligotrophicus]QQG64632.1 hypothetical protein HP555_01525 [Desulfobulbus oligotrophicus]